MWWGKPSRCRSQVSTRGGRLQATSYREHSAIWRRQCVSTTVPLTRCGETCGGARKDMCGFTALRYSCPNCGKGSRCFLSASKKFALYQACAAPSSANWPMHQDVTRPGSKVPVLGYLPPTLGLAIGEDAVMKLGHGGHEATDTGLAYAPVSQAHGHNHIAQCFSSLHCSADQFCTTPGGC